mmetsp:Transcript_22947/g.25585  ORF Transcript_22947/g.25585 Transcript_22947/m.25585 type:complete len:159 (-) Transcript_22947:188-664(-)|eukprot:CAMPEP_0170800708 /NCGR_PEP_ID=MMETSP0733-20121128/28016_1 /TAXON_ID=186038 /ORGANISM="Fragilariopsis kerguelensis, Strain L26-C5" /LENGTH=158 /DNA_ID=CAMNT_0011153111 /DNA_START=58 /DNA_END=534 /DNA_ORIENTATION=-
MGNSASHESFPPEKDWKNHTIITNKVYIRNDTKKTVWVVVSYQPYSKEYLKKWDIKGKLGFKQLGLNAGGGNQYKLTKDNPDPFEFSLLPDQEKKFDVDDGTKKLHVSLFTEETGECDSNVLWNNIHKKNLWLIDEGDVQNVSNMRVKLTDTAPENDP